MDRDLTENMTDLVDPKQPEAAVAAGIDGLDILGPSPQDPHMLRVRHAVATVAIEVPCDPLFNAFTRWARYDARVPALQGPAHWLLVREGGGARNSSFTTSRACATWPILAPSRSWT